MFLKVTDVAANDEINNFITNHVKTNSQSDDDVILKEATMHLANVLYETD